MTHLSSALPASAVAGALAESGASKRPKKKRKAAASRASSDKPHAGSKKGRRTLITLLLDRSGSMLGNREATLEAINGYVDGLRPLAETARFSLIQFASGVGHEMVLEKTCEAVPVAGVRPFTRADYAPSGGTPLLDAVMAVLDGVEDALRDRPGIDPVVAIQTDGMENASTRWSWEQVRARIARKTEEGWNFVFLGAGLEARAYEQSGRLGIDRASTMSYRNDGKGTRAAFEATAESTRAYAMGHCATLSYSAAQKRAAGDMQEDAEASSMGDPMGAGAGKPRMPGRAPGVDPVDGWGLGPMGAPRPLHPTVPPFAPVSPVGALGSWETGGWGIQAPVVPAPGPARVVGDAWDKGAVYVLPRRPGFAVPTPVDSTKKEG